MWLLCLFLFGMYQIVLSHVLNVEYISNIKIRFAFQKVLLYLLSSNFIYILHTFRVKSRNERNIKLGQILLLYFLFIKSAINLHNLHWGFHKNKVRAVINIAAIVTTSKNGVFGASVRRNLVMHPYKVIHNVNCYTRKAKLCYPILTSN